MNILSFLMNEFMTLNNIFPQIAGSYRGSYFSKVGLLITEIAAAPSLPSSFVSLHADFPKSLPLHLSPFICLPAC